jgi:voltage-gated sodium channel
MTHALKPCPRDAIRTWLARSTVQRFLIALILFNAVILGLETSSSVMNAVGPLLLTLDKLVLGIFVIEIALRIYAERSAFFKDAWSLFDFAVVAIALIPASGPFAVLRAFRVLRVLRLLSMIPSMRRVVGGLLSAIPGLMSVVAVIGILFYVMAVISTKLFGHSFPEWFGNLGASAYTLFQIMTLESWSMGIVRPVMETYPHAWLFFIPFILIATFTMLNLFIAIIVNAIQSYAQEEQHKVQHEEAVKLAEQTGQEVENHLNARLERLENELRHMRALLERQNGQPPAALPPSIPPANG